VTVGGARMWGMTDKRITSENYSILKNPLNLEVHTVDYLDMNEDEYRDMPLRAINGEQVLHILDALEFYAKHYKKIAPSRVAKAMKAQSDNIHVEIVDAWRRGVRLDAETWEPLTWDISELFDDTED
jgi:hypothetical protein